MRRIVSEQELRRQIRVYLTHDQLYCELEVPDEALCFRRLMSSREYCNWAIASLRDGLRAYSTGERAAIWRALAKAEREFDRAWPVERDD
ncbi:MAG: hypothetical protein R2909_19155 [Gemmatimonadales bacterium]